MHLEAMLAEEFEGEDGTIRVEFLDYFGAVVLLTGSEDAQLEFFLESIENFQDIRPNFQIDPVVSVFSRNVNGLSPTHILLPCVPIHNLSVD
jgi:hypothetical protein